MTQHFTTEFYPVGFAEKLKKLFTIDITKGAVHLLLSGAAGCGKTTTALALARHYAGDNALVIRLSNKRKSTEPSELIELYTRGSSLSWLTDPDYTHQRAKIVILDELDNLSLPAQSALRGIMDVCNDCLIIATCNTEHVTETGRIIPSLVDRFAVIQYPEPEHQSIRQDKIQDRLADVLAGWG